MHLTLCFPGHAGTAAAAGEAATEAAADTVRATLDPADGGREALHVAARKCGSYLDPHWRACLVACGASSQLTDQSVH